jgi:DNA polymerase III delta prime subunit
MPKIPKNLTDDDLDTILEIAKRDMSGRITMYEVNELVRVYRDYMAAQDDPGRAPDPFVDAAERAALGL